MRKNGQMGSLQPIIITLVIVGILIGIAFLIFQSFMNTTSDDTQYTILGEQLGSLDAGFVYPAHNSTTAEDCRGNTYAVISIVNRTSGIVIDTENYTIDGTSGMITNLSSDMTSTGWDVNYTYYSGGVACKGVESVTDATTNITTYLPIIVVLLVIGIVLAILFGAIPSMSRGGGGTTAEI